MLASEILRGMTMDARPTTTIDSGLFTDLREALKLCTCTLYCALPEDARKTDPALMEAERVIRLTRKQP